MNALRPGLALAAVAAVAACRKPQPVLLYEPQAVARRDIVVSAEANGSIQPIQIVDVKSRASGQILEMRVETGDMVHRGDTLVKVDRRDPTTAFNQAQADLEVAQAQAANAAAQKRRADQMFASGVLSEQDHDNANLADANARAQLVRAQAGLQSAQDALTDCNVLASIDGTILTKKVEAGAVITSAVHDVSGGTVLLQMADLGTVEVQALVDETDIGKVQPGMPVTITVDAYPNRPFQGTVLKIEPQSTVSQNVTMFAVQVNIPNHEGLLRPGMNAEVAVQIGQRQNVLAIPTAALRTQRDVGSAAQVLGIDSKDVDRQLAVQDSLARANPEAVAAAAPARGTGRASEGGSVPEPGASAPARGADPASRVGGPPVAGAPAGERPQVQLPEGVTQEQVRAIFRKQFSGEQLTPQEQAIRQQVMRQFQSRMGGASGAGDGQARRRFGEGQAYQFGGSYIVFALRGGRPTPVRVRTGLTDMDYSEVVAGLGEKDTVLLLPSASLVQQQAEMRDRLSRFTAVPGMQQQQQTRSAAPTATPSTSRTQSATPSRPGPPPGGP
ncbi:MAG TPA: efflux RND transporter periplasmic adaptor subunit [Gemmatimonadales bacterium]|nr:efflux RND transporter periplasmic adaptor subunit [Gemmatimonadales bacterium]